MCCLLQCCCVFCCLTVSGVCSSSGALFRCPEAHSSCSLLSVSCVQAYKLWIIDRRNTGCVLNAARSSWELLKINTSGWLWCRPVVMARGCTFLARKEDSKPCCSHVTSSGVAIFERYKVLNVAPFKNYMVLGEIMIFLMSFLICWRCSVQSGCVFCNMTWSQDSTDREGLIFHVGCNLLISRW